jgi:hypothetical protein
VKKDAVIAVAAIAVVTAISYGLSTMRPQFQPRRSSPFATTKTGPMESGHVVMRVNGEPVTDAEFEAAFAAMPDDMKPQFESEPGKQAFAEQFVRMKLLEQEGRRMGIDSDPRVEAAVRANRTNIVASATADKIVAVPTQQAVEEFYKQNAPKFEQLDVSHIVIAYAGSTVQPRNGAQAPSEVEATNRALKLWQELKAGADFGSLARKYSDDVATAEQDGKLGQPLTRGMLPPELDARVWKIPEGRFSDPIPSRFGIHIFKVNVKRTAPFQQVRNSIARHVKQQNTFDRVEILRKNAKVEFDPKFFPEAKSWPSNNPNLNRGKSPS